MNELLRFLAGRGNFLYKHHDFRIFDSAYAASYGEKEQGVITLTNGKIDFRLAIDHAQVPTASFRAAGDTETRWHSLDILQQFVSEVVTSGALDTFGTTWVRQHLTEIESAFSPANRAATETACRELERRRAERRFG